MMNVTTEEMRRIVDDVLEERRTQESGFRIRKEINIPTMVALVLAIVSLFAYFGGMEKDIDRNKLAIKAHIQTDAVRDGFYSTMFEDIKESLHRIEAAMNTKQDKGHIR